MVDFKAETNSLDFRGQQVVVSGGSNGIGRGLARFYASKGADVLVLGNTPSAGQATLAELQSIVGTNFKAHGAAEGSKQRVAFVQVDLSLVKGMYKAVNDIQEWAGEKGVQLFLQCQGRFEGAITSEGIDSGFAIQVLSRFALSYLLQEAGGLHEGSVVVHVCGAGQHLNATPIIDDLDLTKMSKQSSPSMNFRRGQMNSCIDVYTKELAVRYPTTRFFHIYPGAVKSELIKRATVIPWVLRVIAGILWNIPGVARSPDQYAPVAAYTVDVAAKGRDELCWDENGKVLPLCPSANEDKLRKDLWQAMVKLLDEQKPS